MFFTSLSECDRWLLRQSPAGGTSLMQTLEMALSGDSYNRGMYMTMTSYAMYIYSHTHLHTLMLYRNGCWSLPHIKL